MSNNKEIDLVYHAAGQAEFKYECIIAPGGDTARIRMRFECADSLYIDEKG